VGSCLFDELGALRGGMTILLSEGGSLARLPLSLFTDGPWCGAGANQFDVDLLRITRIRVTLRFLRGPVVRFDVAPRNLGGGR
jgi:hypothetical protein